VIGVKTRLQTGLQVAAVLLLFGLARLHFEQSLTEAHRRAFFHTAKLNLDLRQQLGQMGFLAALSGFRAVVADLAWIQAHSAWERTEWGRMKLLMDTVTALQPRATLFWETAAWHMAWNASVAVLEDSRRQPREVLRIKAQREYFKIGEDYLLRGIQNNPDRWVLYDRLGLLYREKFKDHEKAFEAYAQCGRFPDAPLYTRRFAAYELAQISGREEEAFKELRRLYDLGKEERLPTLIRSLKELEEKLRVPQSRRIPPDPQP
jgi:hypothetical protein